MKNPYWTTAIGATALIGCAAGCAHTMGRDLPSPALQRVGSLPLRFEPAALEGASDVDTVARGKGYTLYLADGAATLSMQPAGNADGRSVRMTLVGGQASRAVHEQALPGTTNYLIGDRSNWRTGVRGYARVRYASVYPGIDVVFYGNEGQLEYDFVVAPGADPSVIEVKFDGADDVRLEGRELVVALGAGEIRQRRPLLYQSTGGARRREVDGGYVVDGSTVRFAVGRYDKTVPLVIDPVLTYASYLGGSFTEIPADIRVDSQGAMYVYGTSRATDYPTEKARQPSLNGGGDVVITKLSPDGSSLIYSTYLGGNSSEDSGSMTIDTAGNVYVLVSSFSTNFPAVSGGYGVSSCPSSCPGDGVWVVKLDPTGTQLLYTAHIFGVEASGGSFVFTSGVALDASGRAVVAMHTYVDAPVVNAAQPTRGGGTPPDGYLFKLNESGSDLVFATYLGGNAPDEATAVATDAAGNAYVVGWTLSSNFPVVNALQPTMSGPSDAFLTVVSPEGQLLRSTYVGGSMDDGGSDIAVLPNGTIAITGFTNSTDFPLRNPTQPSLSGSFDRFVMRLEPNLDLGFSTYLGTPVNDASHSYVTFDPQGNVHLLTTVPSAGLPLAFHAQPYSGSDDVYYAKFRPTGTLVHATYLGGSSLDHAASISADASGQVFVLAETFSTDAPTVNAFQSNRGGGFSFDMYIARLATAAEIRRVTPGAVAPGAVSRVTIAGANFFGDMRVFVSGQPASGVIVESITSMSVLVPPLSEGVYDVAIINPFGEMAALPNGLLYGTCHFALATSTQMLLGSGGSRTIALHANAPPCEWTARTNVPWIVVDTPSGAGSTPVRFTVASNLEGTPRTGTVTVAGLTLTVAQARSAIMDFDGNSRLDLLWHHQGDGRVAAWLMDGTTNTNGTLLDPAQEPDTSWTVAGAGDFDSSGGQPDLVWQNITTGALRIWFMTGLSLRQQTPLGPGPVLDTDWRIRSVGDWDGDGIADLVWHHRTDGRIALWLMNGSAQRSGTLFTPSAVPDVGWKIAGSGDFNRDGHRDLLWQHDDGRLAVWLMNGITLVDGVPLVPSTVPDTDWKVRGVGDVNGDGSVDLIWQHQVSGALSSWLMNHLRMVAGPSLNPSVVADTNWHIVGPR